MILQTTDRTRAAYYCHRCGWKAVLFVSQKVFKLKEGVRIYCDLSKQEGSFHINVEQILDFNTRYNFYESVRECHLGSIKVKG